MIYNIRNQSNYTTEGQKEKKEIETWISVVYKQIGKVYILE